MLEPSKLIEHLQSALDHHRDRHTVLAGNLANLDTPGYRPFDLVRGAEGTAPEPLAKTDPAHRSAEGLGASGTVERDDTSPARADGNAVSLERELAKIDGNRVRYLGISELISRRLALLRYASGGGT
jgi:flagellar basal-body rod protein FlgB